MRLANFDALSFDCYGTLIDWETGLWAALSPWLAAGGGGIGREPALALFGEIETALEAEQPALRYADLLAEVHRRLAARLGRPADEAAAAAFAASIADWPPFADSAAALTELKGHYRLFVLSNVDRRSFAASNAKLGAPFEAVFTAEDIGSYKPDRRNFDYLLARIAARGIERSRLLHVAQSLYHDHAPAKALGLATCWIDRRHGRAGGATPAAGSVTPDFRFESLAALAAARSAEGG